MDVRDLEHFIAVAEELHFARAAARLHIVPAAVSQRVRDLEGELGVRLFERTSRRVVLTPAGQQLLGPARMVLDDLAAVSDLARSLANGSVGRARLGLAPNLGDIGARLVSEVVGALPGLEAVGQSAWGVESVAALRSGSIEAAVVRGPASGPGVSTLTIGEYRDDHVAVSEHDPVADVAQASLHLFQARPFLLPERSLAPVVHDGTVAFFAAHGVAPLWRHHRLQSFEQLMTFVAAGYAAGLVHSHVVGSRFPGVRIVPLTQPAPAFDIVVAWRTDDTSPAVTQLVAVAQRMARAHARERVGP